MPSLKRKSKLKTFVISTALCGGIGYATSYWVHPIWKTEAEITQPALSQLGNYYSLSSMYHLMKSQDKADENIPNEVYQNFTEQLVSYDNLKNFWENSAYYQQKIAGDTKEKIPLLNELIEETHFQPINNKSGKITLRLNESEQLNTSLSSLINNANALTQKHLYDELIIQWKNLFTQVKTAAQFNLNNSNSARNQDWQEKLNMMRSVSPLDEQFTAFHFIKSPQAPKPQGRKSWAIIGAGIGFLFGLFSIFFRRNPKTSE
ncbi:MULTISPECIES: LPS chain length-determining protein [Rodentibacter]|uniref:LPS chain length-determining protein n=1 Tax=Rodentibacter TaxID=1960084 RepID=UPI001CFD0F3A|nr:LPS chain length-determining protein [Rodentibacter sp. JRC1]GJI56718.1 hypothetical protein HEMROJRC1_18300 [Rodentibacter sp. JRC1]